MTELEQKIVDAVIARLFNGSNDKPQMIRSVTQDCPLVGKFCIVRTYSAGVHAGFVTSVAGETVTLAEGSFRLWRWFVLGQTTGALHGVAKFGLDMTKSRVEKSAGTVVLTNAIELIEVAPNAIGKISEGWAK